MIIIEQGDPHHPDALHLLHQSHALMSSEYPAQANHFLSVEALAAPDVHFLTARIGTRIRGVGALKTHPDYGEVKSMFTDPSARGQGIARAVLRAIEDEARNQDLPWLRLETGNTLTKAHRLYHAMGFTDTGPFGSYQAGPHSLFMEKPLIIDTPKRPS